MLFFPCSSLRCSKLINGLINELKDVQVGSSYVANYEIQGLHKGLFKLKTFPFKTECVPVHCTRKPTNVLYRYLQGEDCC